MKIAEINMTEKGSTGKIMLQIAEVAKNCGHQVETFSKKWKSQQFPSEQHYFFGSTLENGIHIILANYNGKHGSYSYFGTKKLVKMLKEFAPDVVHLHNIHGDCINLKVLFNYLSKSNKKVIWTFHDCWPFTGRCPHFQISGCKKWKEECNKCIYPKEEYPKSKLDNVSKMFDMKKKLFLNIKNMTIVTPSGWLAGLVKQSFFKDYLVKVINNGIDLSVFKPIKNDFRKKYNIPNEKFILLGVAFGWGKRKGLDVFIELSKRLDNKKYQIVLVGTDDNVDKQLPQNIISIHCTQNQKELAEIYTAADLFVNPTREEVLGMVNIESNACGTPVLTFRTGGCPECINENTGAVVDCDDIDAMEKEIIRICTDKPFTEEACLAHAKDFDMNDKFEDYIKLYENITHSAQRTI